MSNTISGGISFSGLGSGIDTDSIIASLKSAQEIQSNRYKLSQAEYEYRISALEEVVTQMKDALSVLQKYNTANKMYNLSIESSESAVASATVKKTGNTPQGSYTLDVKKTATSSLYCYKQIFDSKDAVINNTGQDETFTYTYKGVTRNINVANGTNLEQLVSRINNDAKNPGVRATLIKNGDGYMFQIQGTGTGAKSDLSISSSLSSLDSSSKVYTGTGAVMSAADSTFTYFYGGKERTFNVPAGMTLDEFVAKFNEDSRQPLKASLKLNGSDYQLQFTDRTTGNAVSNLKTSTTIEALGGKAFGSASDVINSSGSEKTVSYAYLGKNYSVKIADGATVQDLIDEINANPKHDGLEAQFNSATGQIDFTYKDGIVNPGQSGKVVITDSNGKKREIAIEKDMSLRDYVQQFNDYAASNKLDVTAKIDIDASNNATISYVDKDGNPSSLTVECAEVPALEGNAGIAVDYVDPKAACLNADLEGFGKRPVISGRTEAEAARDAFNADPKNAGLTAEVAEGASGYKLVYKDVNGEEVIPDGEKWYRQEAQDAEFYVNGWEQKFTSSSNTFSEVIEGMEITVKSTGKTVLNTTQDSEKIKENIQEVVEALNMVKGTILQLSKVDTEKDTGEYDTDKMSSSLTWQMGSALTGNYGVQLVLSEYNNIVSGSSTGFAKKQSVDDVFGDLFTALSEIGINTNTSTGSENFGLLEIDDKKLDEALEKDSAAVIELLSSSMSGTTTSADFTVASTGVSAKAGSYNVTYDVDANGQATNVYINGVLAQNDPNFPGRWTVGDMHNEAAGVAIQFANGGMAQGSYSSKINIRQGKLNELIEFLKRETVSSTVEGAEQGKIPTIIASFRESIEQLQDKIDSETSRIAAWEQREKLKYSRLEQTLTEYNSKLSTISSYAQQLNAG
ncbi:flagellar filament capping protein FliD [Taurinivorans muris]|uniref:Filament cap protein n=1 Tax=Taurinivorans muris TaxID=2787751 RepID=A0ABY5Y168_9BACT|nr:flagellar filament capping protein FliD [Desulfovibrionaceae bacterium LT0009]